MDCVCSNQSWFFFWSCWRSESSWLVFLLGLTGISTSDITMKFKVQCSVTKYWLLLEQKLFLDTFCHV